MTASEAATVTGWRAERVTWAECARRLGRHPAALQKAWARLIGRPYDGKSEGRHSSTAYAASITPGHSREVDAPPTTRTGHESKPAVEVCATPAAVPSSHGCRVRAPAGVVERVFVIPDVHVPYHSVQAWHVALEAAKAFKPHHIVSLGDFADFYSVSSHIKHPMRRGGLAEEVAAVNAELDKIQAIGADRVTLIQGNHERRLSTFLATKAPELFGMVSTAELFRVKERGWGYVPYQQTLQIGRLNLTHDVGHCGMNAHRLSRQAYEGNTVIGHTHRLAVEYVGSAKGKGHVGAMLGWLGDPAEIDYMHSAKAAAWQHGFGLAYHEVDTGNVHLVPVPI
ncbi:MAG: metallophosphoesterase, partial [Giesbergeria sp.]